MKMLNISYHKRGKKTESKKLMDLVDYSAFFSNQNFRRLGIFLNKVLSQKKRKENLNKDHVVAACGPAH